MSFLDEGEYSQKCDTLQRLGIIILWIIEHLGKDEYVIELDPKRISRDINRTTSTVKNYIRQLTELKLIKKIDNTEYSYEVLF